MCPVFCCSVPVSVWLAAGLWGGPIAALTAGLIALGAAVAGSFVYLSRLPKSD